MSLSRVVHFCSVCGRELLRHEIPYKICGSCKAKQAAEKIEAAMGKLLDDSKTNK
jgi:hypothetical protein